MHTEGYAHEGDIYVECDQHGGYIYPVDTYVMEQPYEVIYTRKEDTVGGNMHTEKYAYEGTY